MCLCARILTSESEESTVFIRARETTDFRFIAYGCTRSVFAVALNLSSKLAEFCDNDAIEVCGVPLKRNILAKLKIKAQRLGVWFRRLKKDERRLMDLVIVVVERVQSSFLAKILTPVVKRLLEAMGNAQAVLKVLMGEVAYKMMKEGPHLARKICRIALDWGNKSAAKWLLDTGFIQYLTIMDLNKP